jgi:hypothetical protein
MGLFFILFFTPFVGNTIIIVNLATDEKVNRGGEKQITTTMRLLRISEQRQVAAATRKFL